MSPTLFLQQSYYDYYYVVLLSNYSVVSYPVPWSEKMGVRPAPMCVCESYSSYSTVINGTDRWVVTQPTFATSNT